tara:strand:- start:542 stop:739 length:198 start_codon:yes stop_codon:yes gene_type:complete
MNKMGAVRLTENLLDVASVEKVVVGLILLEEIKRMEGKWRVNVNKTGAVTNGCVTSPREIERTWR